MLYMITEIDMLGGKRTEAKKKNKDQCALFFCVVKKKKQNERKKKKTFFFFDADKTSQTISYFFQYWLIRTSINHKN